MDSPLRQTQKRQIQISQPETGDDEWQALREPLQTGWLTQGPKVAAFEKAFAARHGVSHALAVTSATTGLHLALAALDVGPGDEVIIPAFTWISTANCVAYCGATPVFADIERRTFNLDVADVARRVTPRTKAVIAVHLFGLCADTDALRAVLPPSVDIVEDAACAAGGALGDRSAGALGRIGVFSFHPRKSITTGEGGMVTTSDAALADRVQILRNHGASVAERERHEGAHPYIMADFDDLGFNYRMTDLQGAVGLVQLEKLDRFIEERSRGAAFYRRELSKLGWLDLPLEPNQGRHAWQAFVTYVHPDKAPRPRDQIMDYLQQRGIATRPGTHAVHTLGYYRDWLRLKPEAFPVALDCANQSMAIPLHNRMTEDDYAYVADTLGSL